MAGLGVISPVGWIAIGAVSIAVVVKVTYPKIGAARKTKIKSANKTKKKAIYAKSKGKTGIDVSGGHTKVRRNTRNKHEEGDARRKGDQGGSKARNKPRNNRRR